MGGRFEGRVEIHIAGEAAIFEEVNEGGPRRQAFGAAMTASMTSSAVMSV